MVDRYVSMIFVACISDHDHYLYTTTCRMIEFIKIDLFPL